MGRVRRSQKFKSVDPFAKGGGVRGRKPKREMDLPPDEVNNKAKLSEKQRLRRQQAYERYVSGQDDHVKRRDKTTAAGAEGGRPAPREPEKLAVAPRRDGESLRDFNRRVDNATSRLKRQRVVEQSSTKRKKKEYLQSKKRKGAPAGASVDILATNVEALQGVQRADAADAHAEGAAAAAAAARQRRRFVADGDSVEAPPDLATLGERLTRRLKPTHRGQKAGDGAGSDLASQLASMRDQVVNQYRRHKQLRAERRLAGRP